MDINHMIEIHTKKVKKINDIYNSDIKKCNIYYKKILNLELLLYDYHDMLILNTLNIFEILNIWNSIHEIQRKLELYKKKIYTDQLYEYYKYVGWIPTIIPKVSVVDHKKFIDEFANKLNLNSSLICDPSGICRTCGITIHTIYSGGEDMINLLCSKCSVVHKNEISINSSNIQQNKILHSKGSNVGYKKITYFMKRILSYQLKHKICADDKIVNIVRKGINNNNPTIENVYSVLSAKKLSKYYIDAPYILSKLINEKPPIISINHLKLIRQWFTEVDNAHDKLSKSDKNKKSSISRAYQFYKYIEWLNVILGVDYTPILKFIKISRTKNLHKSDQQWSKICKKINKPFIWTNRTDQLF